MKKLFLLVMALTMVGCREKPQTLTLKEKAEGGDAEAQGMLGFEYETKQDLKEAVKWYRKAAEQGDSSTQVDLGLMYYEGRGVKQDFKEAAKWFRKAAKQGEAFSQSVLGEMYSDAQGVEQDFKEAVKWYQKAADQGDASSQSALGRMYSKGQGVEQDFREAFKWHQKAAEQGNSVAQLSLGTMYSKGQGVPENDVTAYAWLNIAQANAAKYSKEANDFVAKLKATMAKVKKMTREQITEAEGLAKEMIKSNPKLLKKKE